MARDKQADLAKLKDIFDQLLDEGIERILSFAGTQLKEQFAAAADATADPSPTIVPAFESLNVKALKDVPSQAMAIWRLVETVRQREARAQLSEDELTVRRARDAERQREHRAQLSDDALTERRAQDAERKRQSRERRMLTKEQFAVAVDASTTLLPASAPRWKDRSSGHSINPVIWILTNYGNKSGNRDTWDAQGLTRTILKASDEALYFAYATWIGPKRHPEDDLRLPAKAWFKAPTAEEAIERRRASNRKSDRRARQRKKNDNGTHLTSYRRNSIVINAGIEKSFYSS